MRALDAAAEAALASGNTKSAFVSAQRAVELDPLREIGHQRLMRVLARAGDRAGALQTYERCRVLLAEELGVDPSPQTNAVHLEVLRAEAEQHPLTKVPLPPLLARVGPLFVGRDAELGQLRRQLAAVSDGAPRVVVLVGDPGIGKTTLAARFSAVAHGEGATVVLGRCDEETRCPYQPFVEALRHIVGTVPSRDLNLHLGRNGSELLRLVPFLADRLPELTQAAAGDPDTERYRLFEAVAGLLASLSSSVPLVLVLDDVQWADRPTLLLMRHLVRYAERLSLLIVATCRSTELTRTHPVSEAFADLRREDLMSEVPLRPLDDAEVATLVEAAGGVGPQAAIAIARATEGNPLYVREMVRHFTETGEDRLTVPEGVKDIIGRRLVRLPKTTLQILTIAAVVGREFGLGVLQCVTGESEASLVNTLDPALAAGTLAEVPGVVDRWTFTHALVRETLYEDITGSRRLRLHRSVAEALETLCCGVVEDDLEQLAYHFVAAGPVGDPAKALTYTHRAGDKAMTQLAYEHAAAHYERAIRGLDAREGEDDTRLRCDLLLALGEARARSGDVRASAAYLSAADLARHSGDAQALARAALGVADVWAWSGTVDSVRIELLEEALTALGEVDTPLRARVLGRLATELYWMSGTFQRRDGLSAASVAVARRAAAPMVLAACLDARNSAIWGPDGAEERLRAGREIVRLAEPGGGDRELALHGHAWCEAALLELGDVAGLDSEITAYQHLADGLRQPRYQWYAHTRRTMWTLLTGNLDAGEALARQGLEMGKQWCLPDAESLFRCQMAVVWQERPSREAVEVYEDECRRCDSSLPANSPVLIVRHAHNLALAHEAERETRARAELERLLGRGVLGLERNVTWAPTLAFLSAPLARFGSHGEIATLYSLLLPYAKHNVQCGGAVACWGSFSHHLGILAAAMSQWEAGEGHFSEAAGMHERLGAKVLLARTRLEWATMLTARGRAEDVGRTRDLVDAVLTEARRLRLHVLERRALGMHSSVVLATILFTDIVDSTRQAAAMGDRAWSELLDRHNEGVRRELHRFGGHEVKTTGDGFVATFDAPARAIHCAQAVVHALSDLDVQVRAGIHIGECARTRDDLIGIAVHTAARVAASASTGEVRVSSTVRDLVAGSGIVFEERGVHTLKGVPGEWRLYAVGTSR
jgi:class 3 adenylate cyclase